MKIFNIILSFRNPKSLQSQAVCKLKAARRWCMTGTPIQNKELDMYSLIRLVHRDIYKEGSYSFVT